MNIKLGFLFALICCFVSKHIFAQRMIVYDENIKTELQFKFSPYERDNSLPNYFISAMAMAQSRMRSYFKYGIEAEIHSQLIKESASKYLINIDIDSLHKYGNFSFKGFDFSHLLLPYKLQFTYELTEINSNTSTTFHQNIFIDSSSHYCIRKTYIDSSMKGAFKLNNEHLIYRFGEQQKSDFDSAIYFIDKYYSEGKALIDIQKDLSKLDTNNIDKIKLQNIDLKYITKRFKKIEINNYSSKLALNTVDPAQYFTLYGKLHSQITILHNAFNNNINKLDSLFYQKGIILLDDNLIEKAKIYFNKSLGINSNYTPSLYQLALLDYKDSNLVLAANKLNRIIKIDTNNIKYNNLANDIYQSMLKKGNNLNTTENYNEALIILKQAQIFYSKNNSIIEFDNSQTKSLKESKYGMYSSYLSIAGAAIQRGRLDMAEDYINIADEYQKANKDAIINTNDLKAKYTLLTTQYLSKSIELKNNYEFQKSKRYWQYADSLCKAHKLEEAGAFVAETRKQLGDFKSNQTFTGVKFSTPKTETNVCVKSPKENAIASYTEHYENGSIYYIYHRFSQAYHELKIAKELKSEFKINIKDSLESYYKESSKFVILNNLKTANLYAWGSKYRAAYMMLSKAKKQIVEDGLQKDSTIEIAITKLESSLQKQEDNKISKLFEDKMLKARQSIDLKDFISMDKYCMQSIEIANNNNNITLDIEYPKKLIDKYKFAIAYQKEMQKVMEYKEKGNINKALKNLVEANKLYDNKSLQKYNLRKTSLYSFANSNSNIEILETTINTALKNNKSKLALDLWKIAIGYSWQIDSELAAKVMTAIAKEDKNHNPDSNKKELYNQRFGKNSIFNKYRKYYLKAFEKN